MAPRRKLDDRRAVLDAKLTELMLYAKELCPEARVEANAIQYEDEDGHVKVFPPPTLSDAEVDRIEDALAARASDIFMATGLLIPCALFDAPEPAKEHTEERCMAYSTLDKILTEAKTLPPDEQRQLRDKLNEWLGATQAPLSEAEFEQHLVQRGILSEVPPPIVDLLPYLHRQPIQVKGKPLSETILEDRG